MSDSIENKNVIHFLNEKSNELKVLRSLLLFGKNTYTYKFAFCEALLRIGAKQTIHQDEIFEPFVKAMLEHVKVNPKQYNSSGPSRFMQAMQDHLEGRMTFNEVLTEGEKIIPNNVFEAFQNLGGGRLDDKNLLYEFDNRKKQFTLRPDFLAILGNKDTVKLVRNENQGRWRVVEEAWKINVSPGLITFNEEDEKLYVHAGDIRIPLRSALDLLLPYQQGRCFYCNRDLNVFAHSQAENFPDIDHFYSLDFLRQILPIEQLSILNPNGIWNLVVSCKECNRGEKGKFEQVPEEEFVQKLVMRNIYYTEEHKHAFKNAIFLSLRVSSSSEIKDVLAKLDKNVLTKRWRPNMVFP